MTSILLKPKEVTLTDRDGEAHTYIISRLPAVAGRELVTQYPITAMPRVGDYTANEALMFKLMAYVEAIRADGAPQRLTSRALVDNFVPDWEILAKLEVAMMEYNVSFFGNGKALGFLETIAAKAQQLLSQTLTASLAQSSPATKPPFGNSEQSTI
jgi:hypothetical protein